MLAGMWSSFQLAATFS